MALTSAEFIVHGPETQQRDRLRDTRVLAAELKQIEGPNLK
jgi:hypothetical protein